MVAVKEYRYHPLAYERYFCGGTCIEDVTSHLKYHLSLHPRPLTCSADTILRTIKELTQDNISTI